VHICHPGISNLWNQIKSGFCANNDVHKTSNTKNKIDLIMPLSSTIYQLDFDLPAVSSIGKTGCQIEQLFLIRRTPSIESHKGGPIELEDNVRLHHREPRGRILVMIEVWCACEEAG